MTYSRAAFQLRGRPIEACSAVWEIDSSGGPLEFVAFRSDGGVSCSDALLSFFGGLPDKSVSMPASGAVEKGRVRTVWGILGELKIEAKAKDWQVADPLINQALIEIAK